MVGAKPTGSIITYSRGELWLYSIKVIIPDCLSEDLSSILSRVANKFIQDSSTGRAFASYAKGYGIMPRSWNLRDGLEMVPAKPHKLCDAGSNPAPAIMATMGI